MTSPKKTPNSQSLTAVKLCVGLACAAMAVSASVSSLQTEIPRAGCRGDGHVEGLETDDKHFASAGKLA